MADLKNTNNATPVEQEDESLGSMVISALHDLCYILAGIMVFLLLVSRVVVVSGSSMKDTLVDGDYVFLLNSMFCGDFESGDVVVVNKGTVEISDPIIKRVIATEGQQVKIECATGKVYVDGKLLEESYLNPDYIQNPKNTKVLEYTVEEGCVFVMGDNRNASLDSRDSRVGMVDTRQIMGKALFVIFPGENPNTESRELSRIGGIG